VSVAQYFAVDYHNVYKYVTDTRGVTPRTYVLYQARPCGAAAATSARRLRQCGALRRRIAASAQRGRAGWRRLRQHPRACGGGALMAPLRCAIGPGG
jgi:hypothetical protein